MYQEVESKQRSAGNGDYQPVKGNMAIETITPERAKDDLDRAAGKNYRRLIETRAQAFAAVMRKDSWELNGETLKYDVDGVCIDGQHRLRACVIAGVPFRSYVVYGVQSDRTIDTGMTRSLRQYLAHHGEQRCNLLASALSWLWKYRKSEWRVQEAPGHIPHSDLLEILEGNPALRDSVQFVASKIPDPIGMRGLLAAFHLLTLKRDAKEANWFIERLGDGVGLKENDSLLKLRSRLIEDYSSKEKLPVKEKLALVIIAWNYVRQGRPCYQLRWIGSGPKAQEFPSIL